METDRRRFLYSVGVVTIGSLAGCNTGSSDVTETSSTRSRTTVQTPTTSVTTESDVGAETRTSSPTTTPAPSTQLVRGDAGDDFGQSVSVSADGRLALVGAPGDEDVNGPASGTAHVFEYGRNSWTYRSKLVPRDGDAGDSFGVSLELSADGSTAVVGGTLDEDPNGREAGSAYVFSRDDGTWDRGTKIAAWDGDSLDRFGWSVGISRNGSIVAVGAPWDEDPNGRVAGSVYVFERNGKTWQRETKLVADDGDAEDQFANSVVVSGDGSTVVVGAARDEDPNGRRAGSTYVFTRSGGSWNQTVKLLPEDGDADDFFGDSVAVSNDGSIVAVGAPWNEDPNGSRAGAVYVFEGGSRSWSQQAKIAANDGDSSDLFGWRIVTSGDGSDLLVSAVADEDPNGRKSGSAYVFGRKGGEWSQRTKLVAENGEPEDFFGESVALSIDGRVALVGASGAGSSNGERTGAGYVFDL